MGLKGTWVLKDDENITWPYPSSIEFSYPSSYGSSCLRTAAENTERARIVVFMAGTLQITETSGQNGISLINQHTVDKSKFPYKTLIFLVEPDPNTSNYTTLLNWLQANADFVPNSDNEYLVDGWSLTALAQTVRGEFGISSTISYPNGFFNNLYDIHSYEDKLIRGIFISSYSNSRVSEIGLFRMAGISIKTCILENVLTIASSAFESANVEIVSLPKCTSIGGSAFYYCTPLSDVYIPNCESIGAYGFYYCYNLSRINVPKCTSIGNHAFASCSSLTYVNISSELSTLGNAAFSGCSRLPSISLPNCKTIGSEAFRSCSALTEISLPKASGIYNSAFYGCNTLSKVYAPSCSVLGNYAFASCSTLTEISLSCVSSVIFCTFQGCILLSTIYLDTCTNISGQSVFGNCVELQTLSVPNCSIFNGSYMFGGCSKLSVLSLPKATIISGTQMFKSCSSLMSLYLLGSSLCILSGTNTLALSPFSSSVSGVYGSIYVPASLLSSYKSATNWAAFSSRFVGV